MPPAGRRARLPEDTRPGQILALALIANAPIAIGFVLAPLLAGGDPAVGRSFLPLVLVVTPLFAVASLIVFVRTPPTRRAHRAARIGAVLDAVALALWGLVAAMALA